MQKPCIYKITNPKGKIYIGQTIDLVHRKSNYKRLNCKSQTYLYNSIKKYGWESHLLEVIEECDAKVLGKREKYWKSYFNVIEEGLNIRFDEERGGKLPPSTCKKISEAKKGVKYSKESSLKKSKALTGKPKSEEHKQNISKAKKGIPNPTKGQPRPKEFGEKISQNLERSLKISLAHTGKKHPRTQEWSNKIGKSVSKPIIMMDLEGNILKEFSSLKEAGEFLGKYSSNIGEACRGIKKTAYGYKWKFKI